MKKTAFLLLIIVVFAYSCKNNEGQLVGVDKRPISSQNSPFGMVYIPAGHFLMGAGDQDIPFAQTNQSRNISMTAFWMDETEITNNEYRQFVNWVKDSIAHVLLGEANIEGAQKSGHYKMNKEGDEVVEPKIINWKEPIPWNSDNEEVQNALSPMFTKINTRFYYYKSMGMNASVLNFEYWWMDLRNYRDPKNPEIYGAATKEAEGSSIGGLYANRPSSINNGLERFIRHEVINIYPDTLCWIHDFTYSNNENMSRSYFDNPSYDNYPVVGVSWVQAKAFSYWRTVIRSSWLNENKIALENEFVLPSEAQWEWAARGDLAGAEYPWGGPYTSTKNGCFLSNFKPQRGNYAADGYVYPGIVGHYHPNDFGLFDMSGNVAEWCLDAYDKSSPNFTHDLNPVYVYYAKSDDPKKMKRKVVRGGSWKDVSYYLRCATRDFEYQDTCKSYIGFRCVQEFMGRDRNDNMSKSSHVY
ncbi:MAG: SUMF1/EgtB/PvdO family nonheme iron enzyme [Bacteroidales bacterium]|jgi:formylglycine-generating enzyme required for sulfatase activity|nr:SUMF1/EgtB/PvdO family nonheme iron enzyme [Bacteroidales bacterium]